MRIYPYTHIRVCSLVFMSRLIVFLLSASYCSKEKPDSTKKLNNYAATSTNMKTSSHAVASVYELDRKYVLIDMYVVFRLGSDSYANFDEFDLPLV